MDRIPSAEITDLIVYLEDNTHDDKLAESELYLCSYEIETIITALHYYNENMEG